MLREAAGIKRIILVCGRTDLRRGSNGLTSVVRLNYDLDPLDEGTLFLFCGSRRDRLKGLLFEGDGMLVFSKYLCEGSHFRWPRNTTEARDISIEQYRRLMDGFTIDSSIRRIPKKSLSDTENPA